jgi:glycosyltransferase involved in cell wall biosynthesis
MPASLSVLLPVYGKEVPGFLRQSLESLCGQTLRPVEVVLVEDGPLGDDLASVIASFRTRLPIVSVLLPVNKGLGIALSEGLKPMSQRIRSARGRRRHQRRGPV